MPERKNPQAKQSESKLLRKAYTGTKHVNQSLVSNLKLPIIVQ